MNRQTILKIFLGSITALPVFGYGIPFPEVTKEAPPVYVKSSTTNFARKQGRLFLYGRPFYGWQYALYPDGDTAFVIPFYNGRESGIARAWYGNGRLKELRRYKNGKKSGLQRGWWPGGQRKFLYHCRVDMYEGNVKEWYPNGQLFRNMNYVNGQEDGTERIWLEDGHIFANYEVRNGRDYGLTGANHCNNIWKNEPR